MFFLFFGRIILLVGHNYTDEWNTMHAMHNTSVYIFIAGALERQTRRRRIFFFGRRRIDLIELKCEMRLLHWVVGVGVETTMRPGTPRCTLYTYIIIIYYIGTFYSSFAKAFIYVFFGFFFSLHSLWNPLNHNRINPVRCTRIMYTIYYILLYCGDRQRESESETERFAAAATAAYQTDLMFLFNL